MSATIATLPPANAALSSQERAIKEIESPERLLAIEREGIGSVLGGPLPCGEIALGAVVVRRTGAVLLGKAKSLSRRSPTNLSPKFPMCDLNYTAFKGDVLSFACAIRTSADQGIPGSVDLLSSNSKKGGKAHVLSNRYFLRSRRYRYVVYCYRCLSAWRGRRW
jgi:hypothetical protein